MKTSAKVIAHSISPEGKEIWTVEGVLWRPLAAELNTHCDFSRNAASSRARSVKKTLQEVRDNLAVPPFTTERRGMSGGEALTGTDLVQAQGEWSRAALSALDHAENLIALGVHKSVVNRLLEPFMWHTVVITTTTWDNFFEQRLALNEDGSKASDPMMYDFAFAIKEAIAESTPTYVDYGEWHLPYITQDDIDQVAARTTPFPYTELCQISTARCAGVSYLTQGTEGRDHAKDLALYQRLRTARPPHWSPSEHPATPVVGRQYKLTGWASLRWVESQEHRYAKES